MKYLLTVMLACIVSFASAQIINIPDPDFKYELVHYTPAIDINQDGEIQVSEALAVRNLYLHSTNLIGIREFANLDSLFSSGNSSSLDVSNMTNLRTLTEYGSGPLNISGCINLESLRFGFDDLPDLTISLPRLKTIYCGATNVGTMILTGCDSLSKIYFNEGQTINKLDISGLNQVDTLTISNINHLIARNCTGLKVIRGGLFFGSVADELDLTGCTALTKIMLVETYFPALDLSTCSSLKILMITAQSGYLQNLNIKNGSQLDSVYLFCSTPPATPLNICADDFEIDSVSHMITRNQSLLDPRPFFINSYCSFYPAGAYNTINGTLKLDLDNNGCDNADGGMPNVPVRYTDTSGQSTINYSSATGDYSVYTNKGIFTVTPYFPYPYFSMSPASVNVTFNTANNLISTNNFCIAPNGTHNDLDITLLPLTEARPGFGTTYQLVYKNSGTTILSGDVKLNFDNSKMNFNNASTTVTSQSPGQLDWSYANLQPFESRTITMTFYLLAPPVNNFNDTLTYVASIDPVAGDETPANNSFILPQRVISSYDPNNKLCLEGSRIDITSLNKPLHYIIHFQNLGTDTAFNIVVADTLTNNVDWESFNFISSSHPCHVIRKNNKLEFYFENINLPYQAINDAGSTGFVAFEVKPKNTLVVGDSINNTAAIYFDFNFPVRTNMATTVIVPASPLAVKLEYFSVSKKDETNVLTWKAPSTNGSTNFEIERSADGTHFNNIGTITATTERCQLPFNYTDEKPLTGKNFYRLKITDADGHSFYSKILEIGNNRSGIEITAVTSDGNNTILYLNALNEQTVQLKIIATDGRIVYAQNKNVAAGNSEINLQLRNLPRGVYSLVVYTSEGEVITIRFVK